MPAFLNPFSGVTDNWYQQSFVERLFKTFLVFAGDLGLVLARELGPMELGPSGKDHLGILTFLCFPITFTLKSTAYKCYDFLKVIRNQIYYFSTRLPYGLVFILLPLAYAFPFAYTALLLITTLTTFVLFVALLSVFAALLTVAVSPIVALVHGVVYFQKKSINNDIRQLVSLDQQALDAFLESNRKESNREGSNFKMNEHTRDALFNTNLLFLNAFPNLPHRFKLTIYETPNEILFNFIFDVRHGTNITKSYLLNEQNTKGIAAFLKTHGGLVEYLRSIGLLEKVTQLIKNPYDKLARKIIDEVVTPPQSFELVFLPKNSPQNTIKEVYAETSYMRIHPKLVLQLQDDKVNVTWMNRPTEGGMQSVIIENAAMPSGCKKKFPTHRLYFWNPKPLKITNTSNENSKLIEDVKKLCVASTPDIPQPAKSEHYEHTGMTEALLNLIHEYLGISKREIKVVCKS